MRPESYYEEWLLRMEWGKKVRKAQKWKGFSEIQNGSSGNPVKLSPRRIASKTGRR